MQLWKPIKITSASGHYCMFCKRKKDSVADYPRQPYSSLGYYFFYINSYFANHHVAEWILYSVLSIRVLSSYNTSARSYIIIKASHILFCVMYVVIIHPCTNLESLKIKETPLLSEILPSVKPNHVMHFSEEVVLTLGALSIDRRRGLVIVAEFTEQSTRLIGHYNTMIWGHQRPH